MQSDFCIPTYIDMSTHIDTIQYTKSHTYTHTHGRDHVSSMPFYRTTSVAAGISVTYPLPDPHLPFPGVGLSIA